MNDTDITKIVRWVNGYFHRELGDDEIIAVKRELFDITYDEFKKNIEYAFLKKAEFFTVALLHKFADEYREKRNWFKGTGLKSFDDLYEN